MGIEPGPPSGGAAAQLAADYNSGRKRRKEPLTPQDPASFALDRLASSNLLVPSRSPGNGPHATAATGIANEAAVRKKRGRPPKVGPAKSDSAAPPAASASASKRCKKEEEDVCFICFDGGNLVLCDRRDCPKAYHPACVKRDESFFRLRVKWNCGWHLCNICQRNALFLCYMCPYSLCKACVRKADILCVRGNKGFCRTCMTTISLIENINQGNKDMGHIDFDDTTNWEYLFKVYWIYLKQKESFTLEELTRATNPWKEQIMNCKNDVHSQVCNDTVSRTIESNCSTQMTLGEGRVEVNVSKRRKTRKQPAPEINSPDKLIEKSQKGIANWASKELLEFVAHMKNGDTSKMSQFEVQALLLEYIKRNNLRDPHGKSHVICDQRLEVLFGKTRVGHFEMLDLLEQHFKEVSCLKRMVRGAADSSSCQLEAERGSKDTNTAIRQKKRQGRKKAEERVRQINLDNYASIDVHNISLIYLKRYLVENLLDDVNKFDDHVVGSVVRIRIYGNDLKQDMYRLVRIVGTSKAAEPYKVGDKTADVMLKILNLDKIEDVGVDAISNQDFSEDECRRLRQSIKCGLVERMTVGEVQKKAIALQAIRVVDVLEAEILKLNHLCDRANELGHRKELREYVEKVEFLKSPEERQRRVLEIPEVHADPRMDPSYHSEEDSQQLDPRNLDVMATKCSNANSKPMELFTPLRGDTPYSARAKMLSSSSTNQEIKTSMSIGSQASKEDSPPKSCESTPSSLELETDAARILEELSKQADLCRLTKQEPETSANNPSPQIASSDASVTSSSTGFVLSCDPCELEKLWHYQDPSGKVQGPFCMLQMRKWHMYGYFPSDLRIWKAGENRNSSVLLTDALSMHCDNNTCHCQSNNTYIGSEDAKVTSDCRKHEHNGQSSSNFNIDVIRHKRNADCESGMVDGATCSDDEKPYEIRGSNEKGEGFQCSDVSSEENQKSPSGESSLTKEEVAGPPLVSSAAGSSATRNCLYEQEDQNVGNEVLKSSKMETEVLPTSDIPGKSSGVSSWGVSFSEIEFSNLQTAGTEPEKGDTKVEKSVNKGNNDDTKDEAVGDRRPQEPSAVPDQNMSSSMNSPSRDQSKIEFSNLVSDIEEVDNKDICSRTGETKPCTCLDLPGQDSGRPSCNAMSSGLDLSIQVSSAVPQIEGMNGSTSMGHCVASGVTCHDLAVSWSTASSLAVNEPFHISNEWVGYSHMHSRPCSDVEIGLDSGPSIRFGEPSLDSGPSIRFGEPSGENPMTFDWLDGPIELATLGDESVSDLLSEVEALESMNGGMMNCVLDLMDSPSNDCFSPLAGLSQTLDPGKSDAWSSTCDAHSHSQTASVGEPQHHHIVFGLDLHDCSMKTMNCHSNPGIEGEKEMKLGLGSFDTRQDLTFLAHAPPSGLPNLNYACSSSQRFEGDTFDFQDLGSQGCPTVPLPLPSSAGPKVCLISEGEIKPVYLSKNHQNFLPQDQTLPLPPCTSVSTEFSLCPEEKGKVNHTSVAISRKEVAASVNFPLPAPLPSQSPPIMSNISSPMEGKEFKQIQISLDKLSPSSQELPLPAPSPPPASKADSSFPKEEQIDLSSPLLPPHPSPLPVSLQPPITTSQDIPLTLAEEGELEPITNSSMEQTCQGPRKSHSPVLPSSPPHVPEIKASSPVEEGEMKPMSDLPERQQKALLTSQSIPPVSMQNPSFKSPSLDTSIDTATGRLPTKESSTLNQSGPLPKTATTSGRPNLHRDSDMHHVVAAEQHSKPTADDGSRRFRKAFWSEGSELLQPPSLTSRYGSGFVKPNRHSWNRQSLFGNSAGGGGSPRQLPPGHSSRGSRICKFYKSGYCKKGASCNYLHPC